MSMENQEKTCFCMLVGRLDLTRIKNQTPQSFSGLTWFLSCSLSLTTKADRSYEQSWSHIVPCTRWLIQIPQRTSGSSTVHTRRLGMAHGNGQNRLERSLDLRQVLRPWISSSSASSSFSCFTRSNSTPRGRISQTMRSKVFFCSLVMLGMDHLHRAKLKSFAALDHVSERFL